MKFVDLKKSLRDKLEPIYLLFGDDRMVIDIALNHILDVCKGDFPEFDISVLSNKTSADDAIVSLNTMPLFAPRRVTIIKDINVKQCKDWVQEYAKQVNEKSVLILTSVEDGDISGCTKVDCNRLDRAILIAKVKKDLADRGCISDDEALGLLVDYCDNDLGRIMAESFKLSSNKQFSIDDVRQNTVKSENYNVFSLTEALGKKDAKMALHVLENLLSNDDGKGVISSIYNHFHRLFYIAVNQSLTDEQVAQQLGIKSYAIKKSRPQVRYFGVKRIKDILDLVRQADYETKTSWASVESYAYYIVLNILHGK